MLRFRSSAFEHGIKENQIKEVIANKWGMTKWFQIHEDINGNSQDMIVGFDAIGHFIEIGLTYMDSDEIVFHADNLTPTWSAIYDKGHLTKCQN